MHRMPYIDGIGGIHETNMNVSISSLDVIASAPLSRRNLLRSAGMLTAAMVAGSLARAQSPAGDFPSKPITVILPFPAGGMMDAVTPNELMRLQDKAGDAARLLRLMANEKRLLILCLLVARGEMDVTRLAEAVELSQSALSQHLAKLREDGLVDYRRESQTLHYRLEDPRAARVLATLKDIFCPDLG